MRIKFSWLLFILAAASIAFSACKAKKGAASANVRTLSVKHEKSYYLSFAGKNTEDSLISTKELANIKNIKIMEGGKEAKNIGLKFTCTIIKTSGESAQLQNDGTEISSEIKDQLKSLQSGDKFTFENIRITTPEGQETTYPSKTFEVK
jgi:hypothetical protein